LACAERPPEGITERMTLDKPNSWEKGHKVADGESAVRKEGGKNPDRL